MSVPGHDPHSNWDGLISKGDAVRRDGGPGGRLHTRKSSDTLELKEVREKGGLFGIGLKIVRFELDDTFFEVCLLGQFFLV
jgi:hypothetical protein